MRFLVFLFAFPLFSSDPIELLIPVNGNHSVEIPGISHASVANGKIARVRSIAPDTVLITGVIAGETMLRVWDGANRETAYLIRVVPPYLNRKWGGKEHAPVVKVSLEFLELESATGQSLGIRWPESFSFSGNAALQGLTSLTGVNYAVVFTSAKSWMNFLVNEGWARILANPDLYVRMGEETSFHSGGELPVAATTESYGRSYRKIEWKEFGLSMKVRPQSADNFHISSDVHIEVSEVNGERMIDNVPSLTKRKLDTKMESEDGETVILSGLVRKKDSSSKEGLPFLAHIPLLGVLFASTTQEQAQTELLMAMTLSLRTKARNQQSLERHREKIIKHYPMED